MQTKLYTIQVFKPPYDWSAAGPRAVAWHA